MLGERFFFGKDVEWWFGVVERRNLDTTQIGRVKVRLFGHHSPDKSQLPTEQLPDAIPLEPLHATLFSTPKEGDVVCGIFLDEDKQVLLMLGKVPAEEQNEFVVSGGEGFRDARTTAELGAYPKQEFKNYTYAVTGVTVEENANAAKFPPWNQVSSLPFRARELDGKVPRQISPTTKRSQAQITRFSTAQGNIWFELPTAYSAKYPFNHVYESESLHVFEFDDTPGSERVHIMHRLGSMFEFHPDGSVVFKSVKDGYEVVLGDKKVGVSGHCDITVNGNATFFVKGNRTEHVNGNYSLSVDGDFTRIIKGKEVSNVHGDIQHKTDGKMIQKAGGVLWLKGSAIQENNPSTPQVDDLKDFDLPKLPENTLSFENQQKLIAEVGSPVAPNDDKDESAQAALQGEVKPANPNPVNLNCPVVEDELKPFGDGDSRYRMQLSRYYQLADMSCRALYPHHIAAQHGLTQAEIICNLAFLTQNSLDAINAQYPGLRINCGFRKIEKNSQHEYGEAVDIQWPSIKAGSLAKYMDIANWIVANVPFDQLIMEHGNTIWFHLSLKRTGTNRKQVLTMKDTIYTAGLDLKGRV
jgi:hypothetical protein